MEWNVSPDARGSLNPLAWLQDRQLTPHDELATTSRYVLLLLLLLFSVSYYYAQQFLSQKYLVYGLLPPLALNLLFTPSI